MNGKFKQFTKKLNGLLPMSGGIGREFVLATFFYSPILAPAFSVLLTGFNDVFDKWLTSTIISLCCAYTCIGFGALADKVLDPWIRRLFGKPQVKHSRYWSLLVSCTVLPLGLYVGFQLNALAHGSLGSLNHFNPDDYRVGMLIGTAIASALLLIESWREAKTRNEQAEIKLKALENERLRAQISALNAQMNPHLMFNALNTVASLVPHDPKKAEEVIIKLAQLYRGVLDSSRRTLHPLATELDICDAYLAVERARFGERLQVQTDIDEAVDLKQTQIPALSLQTLVENAVKHGLAPKTEGGKVLIQARRLNDQVQICIEDDGIGVSKSKELRRSTGAGTGLANLQERFNLHFGDRSTIVIEAGAAGGCRVRLTFPAECSRETI